MDGPLGLGFGACESNRYQIPIGNCYLDSRSYLRGWGRGRCKIPTRDEVAREMVRVNKGLHSAVVVRSTAVFGKGQTLEDYVKSN